MEKILKQDSGNMEFEESYNDEKTNSLISLLYERLSNKQLIQRELFFEFLNLENKHKKGFVFVHEFFKILGLQKESNGFSQYQIIKEKEGHFEGTVDIFIEWSNNGIKHSVIVEFKYVHEIIKRSLNNFYDQFKQEGFATQKVVFFPLNNCTPTNNYNINPDFKIIFTNDLIEWLNNSKRIIENTEYKVFSITEKYIDFLEYIKKRQYKSQSAINILGFNDIDIKKLLGNNESLNNFLSYVRQEKIIELILGNKQLQKRINIVPTELESILTIESYFKSLPYRLAVSIYKNSYHLFITKKRYGGIGDNRRDEDDNLFKKGFKDFIKDKERFNDINIYRYKDIFEFPSQQDFNRLMDVIMKALMTLNKLEIKAEKEYNLILRNQYGTSYKG